MGLRRLVPVQDRQVSNCRSKVERATTVLAVGPWFLARVSRFRVDRSGGSRLEFAQEGVGAAADLARDGERGAFAVDALRRLRM